jgi:hypothetical protein
MIDLKYNRTATSAPTSSNDNTQGYIVGSRWLDIIADKEYICIDSTTALAVWKETTVTVLDNLNDVTVTAPAQNHLLTYQAGQWVNRPENLIRSSFTTLDPATILSPLTNTATGVTNIHVGGKSETYTAGINLVSGRVVAFLAGTGPLQVTYVNGGVSEEVATSQAIGVTLNDALAGQPVNVAISGFCSVLNGATPTTGAGAVRGGMIVCERGTTGRTQRPGINKVSDEQSIGICATSGAVAALAPFVIYIKTDFESF